MNLPLIVDSQGKQTDPGTSTVMADTGALTAPGVYEVLVLASQSAFALYQLQHRNSTNAAGASDVVGFYGSGEAPAEFRWRFFVNKDERVRVMMDTALTGTSWVSIAAWRVE